jgi:3',5'-cyclic AMP phosphodiesterase CpdA
VTYIVHLSDLHLLSGAPEQEAILEALVGALAAERRRRGCPPDLLLATGDVFDSPGREVGAAVQRFVQLHERLRAAAGEAVPTVIVPGNHDRRRAGIFAPFRRELFHALGRALRGRAWVHGCDPPHLAAVIPPDFHSAPLWIVAYDSTYLPTGLISAGGRLRQEDLLHAAALIGDEHPSWPVVFLLHHHLAPTPLTDLDLIATGSLSRVAQWGLRRALPWLVANADREELTMTALGAGTALSSLHMLGRAVLVLHGHKHYATARLLKGLREGCGDVLVVSAGSAGIAQAWNPEAIGSETARLWPSFNVLELEGDELRVDTVSFGYKGSSLAKPYRRPLVCARREGAHWTAVPVQDRFRSERRRLLRNECSLRLLPSVTHGADRWDFDCERHLERYPSHRLKAYYETIEGHSDARLVSGGEAAGQEQLRPLPAQLRLQVDGVTRYRVAGGGYRQLSAGARSSGGLCSPFESAGLMNRYACDYVRLAVTGLGRLGDDAFASATDLGSGLQSPLRVARDWQADQVVAEYPSCPPRTLVRVYWRVQG